MSRIARLYLLVLLAAVAPLAAQAPAPAAPAWTDAALAAKLERLTQGFGGEVGVYVRHLPTGASAAIRADELFPPQHDQYVPARTLYDQVERGAVLRRGLPYPDTCHATRSEHRRGRIHETGGRAATPRSPRSSRCSTVNDDVASPGGIQALVGAGAAVDELVRCERAFSGRASTPGRWGREEARSVYGWGQTTPREIAQALVLIREGRAINRAHRRRCTAC